MLEFIGLGLYDETSITRQGADALAAADVAYLEGYTSVLAGTTVERLEATHECEIAVLGRSAIETDPSHILDHAESERVAFLTGGDPMIATTHVDLRLRANERGIETRLIHGTSAATAAAGLTGLQAYRFGKATTIPFSDHFPGDDPVPPSVIETIERNRDTGLHTLCFLDVRLDDADRHVLAGELDERCLDGATAAAGLAASMGDHLGVVVARAGSDAPLVVADRFDRLAEHAFGPPLHLLVVPGRLDDLEADALVAFGDAPIDLVA